MAYIVTREMHNGYRCGCCKRTWEDTEIVDTLEEALEYLPLENEGGDFDPLEVEIRDGSNNELIAWGRISYPQWGSYTGYKGTRWTGYRQGVPFDSHSDADWEAIDKAARIEAVKRQISKLSPDQKRLERLQQELKELEG